MPDWVFRVKSRHDHSDSLLAGRSRDRIPVVRDFPHTSRPTLRPTQPNIQWVLGLSRGVKWPGRAVEHPIPSSAEFKEIVELYIYSPSGPSWPVLGRILALRLPLRPLRPSKSKVGSRKPSPCGLQVARGQLRQHVTFTLSLLSVICGSLYSVPREKQNKHS